MRSRCGRRVGVWRRVRRVLRAVATGASLTLPCNAQSPSAIHGVVRDTAGQPVGGAVVQLAGTSAAGLTNQQGHFRFLLPAVSNARLTVRKIGYDAAEVALDSMPKDAIARGISITLKKAPLRFAGPSPAERPLDIRDDTIADPAFEDVIRAARLPPLDHARLSGGDREVRLALEVGLSAVHYLVVVRWRAGRATGEVWRWQWLSPWDAKDENVRESEAYWRQHIAKRGCQRAGSQLLTRRIDGDDVRTLTNVCRAVLRPAPDWNALWRGLDSVGVWTLPDGDELSSSGVIVTDGAALSIEMFDGEHYRFVHAPVPYVAPAPEAARTSEILRLLGAVLWPHWDRPPRRESR